MPKRSVVPRPRAIRGLPRRTGTSLDRPTSAAVSPTSPSMSRCPARSSSRRRRRCVEDDERQQHLRAGVAGRSDPSGRALAMSPNGTLFAGTGETNPGGGSLTFGGTGMYRSRDRGESWQRVGLERSGAFGRIVTHPRKSRILYAAAAGHLYLPGGQRGVFKSWMRNLPRGVPTTACRTATSRGTCCRSRAPRPTRRGSAVSPSRSTS